MNKNYSLLTLVVNKEEDGVDVEMLSWYWTVAIGILVVVRISCAKGHYLPDVIVWGGLEDGMVGIEDSLLFCASSSTTSAPSIHPYINVNISSTKWAEQVQSKLECKASTFQNKADLSQYSTSITSSSDHTTLPSMSLLHPAPPVTH